MMDVQMPELSGLDATAEIRAQEGSSTRHTPIVAVTANAMSGDREKCMAAGMDAYTSKPVSPQALMRAMSDALAVSANWAAQHPRTPDPLESPPPAPLPASTAQPARAHTGAAPALDVDKLSHRLGPTPGALTELARTVPVELANHEKALTQALGLQDKATATAQARALKGTLAGLTAHRAAALANGLELAARSGEWSLFGRALPVLHSELAKVNAALQTLRQPPTH
jgi:CheY-like chemotaxis protein